MKTLEIGENIKLGEFGRTFVLSTNSDSLYLMNGSTVVGQIYDGMVIDLNSYLAQAIKNLEIVCVQDKVKPIFLAILKDETPICKYTVDTLKVGSKTVLGKFYFYTTNEWRYRALDSDATEQQKQNIQYFNNSQNTQRESLQRTQSQSNAIVQVQQNNATGSDLRAFNDMYSGNIELSKMQSQNLPESLRNLYVGFGWKSLNTKAGIFTKIVANQSLDIDLDLALLTFTKDGFAEVINGFNTRSSDNAIYHYGDKTESQGDSEMISISFPVLNPKISHIAIVVTSAKGHKFNLLEQSTLNLRNQEGMLPLVSYNLQNGEEKSSCLIGILIKRSNCWEFQTIEDYSRETNPRDLKDLTLNWIKFIK